MSETYSSNHPGECKSITPVGKFLVGVVLPSQLYDVAYY